MSEKDRQYIEALARGLAILETLSKASQPLSNGDLAGITGLAPSTVSRLLHTLMELGYVRPYQSGRAYELTPKNLTLGYPVLAGMRLLDKVRPHLEEISRKTGETSALAIRDRLHVTFVAVHEGANLVAVRLATGGRLRIGVSAAGVALVAAAPEAERRQLISRVNAQLKRSGQNPQNFRLAVDRCVTEGVAIVRNLWQVGVGGIAVAIPGHGEHVALTIAVSTGSISEHAMRTRLAETLKDAANAIGSAN